MGWYHALVAEQGDMPKTVYHLCPKYDYYEEDGKTPKRDKNTKMRVYFPKSYDDEKFVRTTHDAAQLTNIANCFYQKSSQPSEQWVCLEIDTMGLKVNGIEVKVDANSANPELKCTHIFGGLPEESVRRVHDIRRDATTGGFVEVVGLKLDNDSCGCPVNGGTK